MSASEQPEAKLYWHISRWQGELPNGRFIWMEDKVFQEYAHVWAAMHTPPGVEPTEEQLWAARQHCRKISYWVGEIKDTRIYIQPPLPPRPPQTQAGDLIGDQETKM